MKVQKILSHFNKPLYRILASTCKLNSTINISDIVSASQVKFCHNEYDDDFDRSASRYDNSNDMPSYARNPGNRSRNGGYRENDRGDRNRFRNYAEEYDDDRPSYGNRNHYQRDSRRMDNFNRNPRDGFNYRSDLHRPDWNSASLEPFEKNFYVASDRMKEFTDDDIKQYRKSHNMTLFGNDIPIPIQQFSDYNFPESISKLFKDNSFENPTAIQAQGWPIGLSGRDLIGIGQTGSGKTLGFLLPALIHISQQPQLRHGEGPIALVMAPTRELVQQIHNVARSACRDMSYNSVCVFGGASKGPQSSMLRSAPSICVATPGRLMDFLEMGVTNLKRCTFLVLDEADRMLDMGFEPQIRKIVDQIRPDRQTTMWSATWPDDVQELAGDFLNDDTIRLMVGSTELQANPDVIQKVVICDGYDKHRSVEEIINTEMAETENSKILIFCETKRTVDSVARSLSQARVRAESIHGDHSQAQRDRTLNGFRKDRFPILVATNVAARGLDVKDITVVINFDFPNDIEDYVHRIGRTGRAGKSGKSISLISRENGHMVDDLIRMMKKSNQEIPEQLYDLKTSGYRSKKQRYNRGGHGGQNRNSRSRNFNY